MQDMDDGTLTARTLAGDTDAFEALVTRYQAVLFRVAMRLLGEYADAADATQTAFVKAYERLETYDPQFRFFSWLYRILVNECLNVKRGRRPYEEIGPDLAVEGTTIDALEVHERRRLVQEALLQLPMDLRQVLVLRHYGELSYDEIAATLGVPVKTVKSRLYSARQRLSELLLPEARIVKR